MGNGLAYAVLAIWPLIAIKLYKTKSIQEATLWTIIGGFMCLAVKTEVDLPMIPAIGKHTMPVVSALMGCILIKKRRISYLKGQGGIKYLLILFIVTPFITATFNGDAIIVGDRFIRSFNYYDGLSATINQFLIIVPFFIGRQFFKTYDDHLLMFRFLVIAGLIYTVPMLYEIRLSPQLHTIFYGYFPHSFAQQVRAGGFRPVVFMGHGLLVGFFTFIVLLSVVALWEIKIKIRQFSPSRVSYYVLIVLVLCKSKAALLYGLLAFFMIKKTAYKTQMRIAVLMVIIALSYPSLSIIKVFPHESITQLATDVMGEQRSQSLKFRFDNENVLLSHARERLLFGWGGWGRNRVYSEVTGRDITVTDGRWIITFGQFGLFGFMAEFGLLAITVFRANKAVRLVKRKSEQTLLAAHALLVGIVMIDQLPNASLAPWLWLLTGILLGRSETIIAKNKVKQVSNLSTQ